MALPVLAALVFVSALPLQESVVPPPPRDALPRPVASAPLALGNDNRHTAGTLSNGTLTLSLDIVEAAWNIAMPILDVWQALPARDFPNYSARQSWGPETAETLIHRDGREWRKY